MEASEDVGTVFFIFNKMVLTVFLCELYLFEIEECRLLNEQYF